MASWRRFSAQEALEMLQKLDDCDSGGERDSDGSWSVVSSSDSGSESEPPLAKKRRVAPLAGATVPQSAQVQRQGDEPGAPSPAINPAIQLTGRRETTNQGTDNGQRNKQ
ncbi:hypothetical protein GOODEAATRI_026305 [Goodea atripinnis]|uniref:Uncharacterized protein n=1 Tax=Goodea atripinnis TaxID=208336 RepID=A0ABV0NDV1_9TELE